MANKKKQRKIVSKSNQRKMHKSKLDFFSLSCDSINELAIYPVLFLSSPSASINGRFKYLLNCFRFVAAFNFSQFHLFTLFLCMCLILICLREGSSESKSTSKSKRERTRFKKNNDWNQFSGWVFLRTTFSFSNYFCTAKYFGCYSCSLLLRLFVELINVRLQVLLFWHPVRLLLCHYCRLFIHL